MERVVTIPDGGIKPFNGDQAVERIIAKGECTARLLDGDKISIGIIRVGAVGLLEELVEMVNSVRLIILRDAIIEGIMTIGVYKVTFLSRQLIKIVISVAIERVAF